MILPNTIYKASIILKPKLKNITIKEKITTIKDIKQKRRNISYTFYEASITLITEANERQSFSIS